MSKAFMNLPTMELLHLWVDFWQCLQGAHGFGGTTAEIYAYRFWRYTPSVHATAKAEPIEKGMMYFDGARALVEALDLFCSEYDAVGTINGLHPTRWLLDHGKSFDWRCEVSITPLAT